MIWIVSRQDHLTSVINSVWDDEAQAMKIGKRLADDMQFMIDHDTWEDGESVPTIERIQGERAWSDETGGRRVQVTGCEINAFNLFTKE